MIAWSDSTREAYNWKKAGIGGFKQGNRGACRIIPAKGR